MPLLQVHNKNGDQLAVITFAENNQPIFLGEFDSEFQKFVQESLEKVIDQQIDIEGNGTLSIVSRPIKQDDTLFPLAFKEFLERSGYGVTEKHPEVEDQIKQLLASFPDDNPDKKDILDRLSEMSYLEQTAILEGLKNLD